MRSLTALLLVVASAPLAAQELLLEDLEGRVVARGPAALPLTDPRPAGHFVRPRGFGGAAVEAEEPRDVAEITLSGGDRLRGTIAGGAGEELWLELVGGVRLPIGIGALARAIFPARLPERLDEPLGAPDEGDRLYRRTGASLDRIDGTIEGFGPEGVRFDSRLGSRTFAWEEVAALFVEVLDGGGARRAEGLGVVCDLVDGSRVRGTLEALTAEACELSVAGGQPIAIAWRYVVEVLIDDGKVAFLSEEPPVEEHGRGVPFDDELGMVWPLRLDRSVTGTPLRAGGEVWSRGIGMHAPDRASWRLAAGWSEMRGKVAVDESALANPKEARGSVVFRVEVDGETRWQSDVVRGGDPPLAIPPLALDPARAHEIVLVADPAGDFRGDRADWLRVHFVRR
jgi:hypothetical protein